jgi:hypothetical protein
MICQFQDVQASGKYNLTLYINNEEMSERILDEVILYKESILQRDLKLASPSRNFLNLTHSLKSANL